MDTFLLDKKYFIDYRIYNCPFCKTRRTQYTHCSSFNFNWDTNKQCFGYLIQCDYCKKVSMHLSWISELFTQYGWDTTVNPHKQKKKENIDLDLNIFYSVPVSFFALDNKIPAILRELIVEAEGCLKMNFLTGASACTRKAIYELTVIHKCEDDKYEDKIKSLKSKYPNINSVHFDILSHIQQMTSDKIHEQSWDEWDSKHLTLFLETIKSILLDIYVVPKEKEERTKEIGELFQKVKSSKA